MKTKHILHTLCYSLTLGLFITSCALADYEESDQYPRKGNAPITQDDVVKLDEKGINAEKTMSFNFYRDKTNQAYVYDVAANSSSITVPPYVSYEGKRYMVTGLGSNSFENCTATTVNLPSTIESIENYAFKNAEKVVTINLNSTTPPTLGSNILDGAKNAVILVPQSSLNSYQSSWSSFADRLSYIGDNSWLNKVKTNAAGDAVRYVYDPTSSSAKYHFQDDELSYAILADNAGYTVYSTLKSTYSDLVVPGEIRYYFTKMTINYIYSNAFKNSSYKSITLPSSITGIGGAAFQGCSNLMTVNLPSTITTIGEWAFKQCVAIRKIEIPDGVTVLNEQAFYGCTELNTVKLSSSLTSIEQQAFYGCSSLYSIDLPATLTSLGKQAFANCKGLETVICRAVTPPSIGSDTFNFANSSACVIYVPAASVDAYKQAPNWRNMANRIQAL